MRDVAVGVLVAVLSAVGVALVGKGAGLFGRPDPTGSVTVESTLRNQTLRMFRGQATVPGEDEPSGLTLELQRTGRDVSSDGCRLRWTYLDADGPAPVADASLVAQVATDVSPDPRSCITRTRLWVPVTAALEGYERVAVRVELLAGDHLLGSAVTETLTLG